MQDDHRSARPGDFTRGWVARVAFEIDPARRKALVLGLDAVGATLQDRATIASFERSYLAENPWLA
jgi:hypothetical protein